MSAVDVRMVRATGGNGKGEGRPCSGGGKTVGRRGITVGRGKIKDDAEKRRNFVELTVPALESGASDDPQPLVADEGGAEEVFRLFRRYAQKDIADNIIK